MPSTADFAPARRSPLNRACLLAFAFGALLAASGQDSAPAADSLTVLSRSPRRGEGPLRDWLRSETRAPLERRRATFESLKTPEQIAAHQRELRARFIESLGGFPERTPLNARVVGELRTANFRIEKIVFESQPGFYVSALLYLPANGTGPHPVVLMPCGHSSNGKAAYQPPAAAFAQHGIAVFCFDPIGQSERGQLPASITFSRQGGPPTRPGATSEHTILAVAPILLGRNLATDMIWDGIRAIDYLETRRDIDPKRIACAGNSGGGMMTSYLVSLDDRLVAGGIGCFMTTSARKNEKPGAGDAEQNIFAQYEFGMDLPDYLTLAAPRPVVILSATRDYVPIAGAWEAFRDAKRLYARLGHPERIDLIETDATHGWSLTLREGAVRWLRRWLCDDNRPVVETDLPRFTDAELACTPEGSVLALPGARSVFDLNRAEASRLASSRRAAWARLADPERRDLVRRTAGIRKPGTLPAARVEPRGELRLGGLRVEKLVLARDGDVPLPALRFRPVVASTEDTTRSGINAGTPPFGRPVRPANRAALYIHGRGKHIDAAPGGPIAALVAEGVDVLAVDLRGFGETAMDGWRTSPVEVAGPNGAEFHVAYMLGRSLVGLRAEDVLAAARAYSRLPEAVAHAPELIAVEEAGIPALHAAAVDPKAFSSVRLIRTLDSWQRVFEPVVPERQLESVVHGVLKAYDLPDLLPLAGHVSVLDPVTAAGHPLSSARVSR